MTSPNPYLQAQRFFPDDPQFLQRELNNSYVDIANSVNIREIGVYSQSKTASGQTFDFLSAPSTQEAQRKVFSIGPIVAGATLNTPHELTGFTTFTRIYGVATTATDWRPIPYASATAVNTQIEINVTVTNIVIINGAAAPNIVSAIVVVEFI